MDRFLALLIPCTLFTIMFSLSLGLPPDSLEQLWRRRALLWRVLLGSCLLVPLMAMVVLKLPAGELISKPTRFAIALLALSPSAPLTLRKSGKAGGHSSLAAGLQVSAAIAAIVSIPVMATLFTHASGVDGWDIGPYHVAKQIGVSQVLPLGIGLLVRQFLPSWAEAKAGFFEKLANVLLLVIVVVVLVRLSPMLLSFARNELFSIVVMAALVLASMAIGYALAGSDPKEQTTAALVTSMRNPGLALLFAQLYGPSMIGLKIGILAYLLVTVLVQIPFTIWSQKKLSTL